MYSHGTKGIARIKSWVQDLIHRADRELCMEEDEFAHRIGWTVTPTGFGSRHYRDPRFDRLKADRLHALAARDGREEREVPGNVAA
ncbi:hypothetical protein C1I98_14090 [Spongiactinospora gelatinilytica]|uniref:Uncharacterized protein n=2 Tax=Spongiactinospora gelatinilytica TaxID=2666298 RepID=A0A2W2GWF5_9ACTN|nr:hypothetical protein C1I98_14090 [Spongiactinospora gelatinilytica]